MGFVLESWFGKTKLWKVFWLAGILFGALITVVSYALKDHDFVGSTILFLAVIVIYLIWILVSQWRCAFNCNWKGWGYLVRLNIIATLAPLVYLPFSRYFAFM